MPAGTDTCVRFSDKMTDQALDTLVPVLKGLPIVGKEVLEFATDAQALAQKIVNTCKMVEKILPRVEAGLIRADKAKLQTSTGQVQQLTKSLQALIPAAAK